MHVTIVEMQGLYRVVKRLETHGMLVTKLSFIRFYATLASQSSREKQDLAMTLAVLLGRLPTLHTNGRLHYLVTRSQKVVRFFASLSPLCLRNKP